MDLSGGAAVSRFLIVNDSGRTGIDPDGVSRDRRGSETLVGISPGKEMRREWRRL